MTPEVRERLREVWDGSVKMMDSGGGLATVECFVHAARHAVVRIWDAHGYEYPPCRHCWQPQRYHDTCASRPNGCPITATNVPATRYTPVEGW